MTRRWIGAAGLFTVLGGGCAHDGSPRWHRVATGDTLSSISARYRIPVGDLVAANAVSDPDHILVGDLVLLPARPLAARHERTAREVPVRSAVSGRRAITLGSRPLGLSIATGHDPVESTDAALAWPVHAPVSSRFGWRDGRLHQGIDLVVPDDPEVRAAADGEVVYAGDKLRGYGNLLMLRHDRDLTTIYAHNSVLLVAEGARVQRGEVIARSGHSGHATAPHVHFEVREGARARDPEPYLATGLGAQPATTEEFP